MIRGLSPSIAVYRLKAICFDGIPDGIPDGIIFSAASFGKGYRHPFDLLTVL